MERRYVPAMDRQLQAYWLREYTKLPASQRVAAIEKWLGGSDDKAINRALDKLAKTKLGITEQRLKLMTASSAELEKSKDPAIQFAVAIMPTVLQLENEGKARAGDALLARPLYLQAVADYSKSKGQFVYPDANSSLRITFGNVTGYTKLDGSKQVPFTRLEEVADQGHRPGAVQCAQGAARCDRGEELRRPGRQEARHGAGELPVRPRHHRRQFRLAGARRAGQAGRPGVRRQLGIGQHRTGCSIRR